VPPLDTSPDRPVPVRVVSSLIAQWVARLGRVWVEGQVAGLTRRPGARTVFLTLRDPAADVSLPVTCPTWVLDGMPLPLSDGAHVVVAAKPDFYAPRGTLSLAVTEIRPLGMGALLVRLEQLKGVLAAEGLFDADRKRPLPFLPGVVGLVCGRASAAERDVVENSRRRWPAVRFRVREVAVQGVNAVAEVSAAIRALDADPEVQVIVVARGGGSLEDLLPFSNEAMVRTVAACTTPVVSAIGHEVDTPLFDLVADVRASTPTDAAKRVVPDVAEETARVAAERERLRRAVTNQLAREQSRLDALRSRPVLAEPGTGLAERERAVRELRDRARRCLRQGLHRAEDDLAHTRARVAGLSPAATLARGYAVVQRADGAIVRRPVQVAAGDPLRVWLAEGELAASVASAPG
jgi:exodeoxyribonuclease VII large subunit